MYIAPPREARDLSKLMIFMLLLPLWVCAAFGDILSSILSNYDFGKRSVARDMSICGLHFLPHVTNNIPQLGLP